MLGSKAPDEERRINEEYKLWKKMAPTLYDLVMAHALEWPSLTVQWLPDKVVNQDRGYSTQRLLLGTHTSDQEQNYLVVASVNLPIFKDEVADDTANSWARVEVQQRIVHDGEVNRARYMPQNPDIVATKTVSSQLYVFDLSKQQSCPPPNGNETVECKPTLRLQGHKKEGYGLAFNGQKAGVLASGSDDALVCVWDIDAPLRNGHKELMPFATCAGHTNVVEDVCWHASQPNILASVSDDRTLKVWDIRDFSKPQGSVKAHASEVNTVQFNPFSQFILATGSGDKTAALWDMRTLKGPLLSLAMHKEDVLVVQWSPFSDTILATSGADRRICIWDITQVGKEQSAQDAEDGPPELMFIHSGHTGKVSDICWNAQPGDEWVMASVAEDNVLQVWSMSEMIYDDQEPNMEDDS